MLRGIRNLSLVRRSFISKESKLGYFSKCSDTNIGKYTYLGSNCVLNLASIGNYCSIATGVRIGLGSHPLSRLSTSPIFHLRNNALGLNLIESDTYVPFKRTKVGHDVWIGANVIIMDGITIGDGAIIGAGSVVTKNVPSFTIVAGVPARQIRDRFPEDVKESIISSKWWMLEPIQVMKLPLFSKLNCK